MQLDPRVKRFQELKAERKAAKIKEAEAIKSIKAQTPTLTDQQARQVYDASEAQKARTSQIQVRGHSVIVERM
jgi:hypothetical protein